MNDKINMVCVRCKFVLVGSDGNETTLCPNGCGPLLPMTYQQQADSKEAEIERLRVVLREVRRDVIESADNTIWMRGGIETVVDRINAALGEESESGS